MSISSSRIRYLANSKTVTSTALALTAIAFASACSRVGTASGQQAVPASAATPFVLDRITVIDVVRGELVPDQRVVIVGNRIRAMGSWQTVTVPASARTVDMRGKYLIPGLWDMHVHGERSTDEIYPLLLANGVTGMRDPGSMVPLDTLRLWRGEILAGRRLGPPRQILSGHSIEGPEVGCERNQWRDDLQLCVRDTADARHLVDSLAAAGADMIKPRDVRRAIYFAVAAEARRLNIPFGGHAQEETPLEASDSGARIIDHMQYQMGARGLSQLCWGNTATVEQCGPIAERFQRNGTWLVPTLAAYVGGGGRNARRVMLRFSHKIETFWAGELLSGNWLRDSVPASPGDSAHLHMRVMQQVRLPILAGTDVATGIAGFLLHAELAMYVAEGLTPLTALQTATLNPAKALHATDSLGSVAPGMLADLVILDANPLMDITNTTTIHAVIANGRYYDRTALDRILIAEQKIGHKWMVDAREWAMDPRTANDLQVGRPSDD